MLSRQGLKMAENRNIRNETIALCAGIFVMLVGIVVWSFMGIIQWGECLPPPIMDLSCNAFTSRDLNRTFCISKIVLPNNSTLEYITNHDEVKIYGDLGSR